MKILSIKKLDEIDGVIYAEITYRSWFRNVKKLVFRKKGHTCWHYADGASVLVTFSDNEALGDMLDASGIMRKYEEAQKKKEEEAMIPRAFGSSTDYGMFTAAKVTIKKTNPAKKGKLNNHEKTQRELRKHYRWTLITPAKKGKKK